MTDKNKCAIIITHAEWGKRLGSKQPSQLIYMRLKNGWTEREAVTVPLGFARG